MDPISIDNEIAAQFDLPEDEIAHCFAYRLTADPSLFIPAGIVVVNLEAERFGVVTNADPTWYDIPEMCYATLAFSCFGLATNHPDRLSS